MGAAQHYTHVPGAAHWASIKQASALVHEGDTHPPKEKEKKRKKDINLTENYGFHRSKCFSGTKPYFMEYVTAVKSQIRLVPTNSSTCLT